jgi:hypothetical protein
MDYEELYLNKKGSSTKTRSGSASRIASSPLAKNLRIAIDLLGKCPYAGSSGKPA